MSKNLVIVESPAKAKTIEKFLGKDYKVKSSMGHIRDLPEKNIGIDIAAGFVPLYEILPDKKSIIKELKSEIQKSDVVWLATDEDREGEAISWHLQEVLNLPAEKTKRIAFHEITKPSILNAIANPRELDINLVNAQQARRVLDRLVGFELSPVLWRKVKPSLSAGRVQSVAVRLIVEREKEINQFKATSNYRVVAQFLFDKKDKKGVQAELNKRFDTEKEAIAFLEKCKEAIFTVNAVTQTPTKKSPAAPFTTSTLQQEAARKLGFSVSKTMTVAQQLYEAGHITYMRTDSVNLSNLALVDAKKEIEQAYGDKYAKTRKYTTKIKGAQGAHEAIRPTDLTVKKLSLSDNAQNRLYELIWKRTIASQMSDALFEKTTIDINISNAAEKFVAIGEVLLFDGFLKVYLESKDDEGEDELTTTILPSMKEGMELLLSKAEATEKYAQHPPRYTEASLVKKMEDLGIGRPSTYAPTISTIQKRKYVERADREGVERKYKVITLAKNDISVVEKKEIVDKEKGKLCPTDIGIIVNDFLSSNFQQIVDYDFTANVEKQFDEIASGKKEWKKMIEKFYAFFHEKVDVVMKTTEKASGAKLLGQDPKTGKNVYARLARFGPVVQIGEPSDDEKPVFASLLNGQHIETISLREALDLFKLPRVAGTYNGEELVVNIGRFGPYVRYNGKFYAIPRTENLMTISVEQCLAIIKKKEEADAQKGPIAIGVYQDMEVYAAVGRYGPYVACNKQFYPLPANTDIKTVTLAQAIEAIQKKESKNTIKLFEENKDVRIMKGRYGYYIAYKGKNYKIDKNLDSETITLEQCLSIIQKADEKDTATDKKAIAKSASTAKSTTAKKTSAKKK